MPLAGADGRLAGACGRLAGGHGRLGGVPIVDIVLPATLAEYIAKWPALTAKPPAALWYFAADAIPVADGVGDNDFITDNNSSYLFAQPLNHPDFPGALCCVRNAGLSTDYLQATTLGEPAFGTGDFSVITIGQYPATPSTGTNTLTTNRSTGAGASQYYTGTGQEIGSNFEDTAGNNDYVTCSVGAAVGGKSFVQVNTKSGTELDVFWAEAESDETLHEAGVATAAQDFTPTVIQRLGGAALGASAAGARIAMMAFCLHRYVLADFDTLAGRITGTLTEA